MGWGIRSRVPHKKVNLELGSNAPLIVNHDGDWETAADKAQIHAFSHAGQSCISIQRILLHEDIADQFIERLVTNMESLTVGDPLSEDTDVGPLITPGDRDRVKEWIDEAVAGGGKVLTGGELVDEGRCLAPTLIEHPDRKANVWCEEIFGPVATVDRFSDETGVCPAGFNTTALPAAIAGPSLWATRFSGKLNGLIAPTTP